jgi:hypothetical protein
MKFKLKEIKTGGNHGRFKSKAFLFE